jgi:hypothetical protein
MNKWNKWHKWISWISGVFGAASIALGFFRPTEKFDMASHIKVLQAFVLLIWVIGPPIWFWYEYYFLYRKLGPPSNGPLKQRLDEYKHGVDVSSKIWLALVTVLLAMYFGKDFARDSSPPAPCVPSNLPHFDRVQGVQTESQIPK